MNTNDELQQALAVRDAANMDVENARVRTDWSSPNQVSEFVRLFSVLQSADASVATMLAERASSMD